MGPKGGSTFLEGFYDCCRAVIEKRPGTEDLDFGQVSVRAALSPDMHKRKPRRFLKISKIAPLLPIVLCRLLQSPAGGSREQLDPVGLKLTFLKQSLQAR